VADEIVWPIESIPNEDGVFMRAHRQHFANGEVRPGVFRPQDGGMSVNWEKYASAEDTKRQATRNAQDNAVLKLSVRAIRDIPPLKVEHTPQPNNRAHTDVNGLPLKGEECTRVRLSLSRIAKTVIPLE
jgi:hypothetical protein